MFLYKNKIQSIVDFDSFINRTVSSETEILLWDTTVPVFANIAEKYSKNPRQLYTFPDQRIEMFLKIKEKKEYNTKVFLNFFNDKPVQFDFSFTYRNNHFHAAFKVVQSASEKNIKLKCNPEQSILFVNYKLPLTYQIIVKALTKIKRLVCGHRIKAIIYTIKNPDGLDFIQLNNLSRAAKLISQQPKWPQHPILINVTDIVTFQKLQFIFSSQGLPPAHHADTTEQAIDMIYLYRYFDKYSYPACA